MGALEVSRITRPGLNFVGGVVGLRMSVNAGGSRSWALHDRVGGIRRDMGLSGYPDVTLAQLQLTTDITLPNLRGAKRPRFNNFDDAAPSDRVHSLVALHK